MKKVLIALVCLFIFGCGSAATFTEKFEETPVKVKSVGEGIKHYQYKHNGKNYLVVRGKDGKYYAIERKYE